MKIQFSLITQLENKRFGITRDSIARVDENFERANLFFGVGVVGDHPQLPMLALGSLPSDSMSNETIA